MYYFKLRADDPMPTKYNETEKTLEEMRNEFKGKFIQVGDEPHDQAQIIDILTEEEFKKYY